ncbi:multidrug transporter subunit MdtD [Aquabacterium sp. A7-Y]|uniref:multidrug transporter subunit MdtD n=1 Tax=Aquabacterium sp. A7-Y TaxID=1349605 RepID=UPI00223DA320|nr:multidrug transporter subunit MdtD [Aquabacterium sp. A7-Y]MCW7540210.1 multidrug transporter subunit MdtD [Aquabacterium sp. A7-Y]
MDPADRRTLPWLVAIAFFMQTLDATILNTALPRMALDLHESPLRMQSVVVAYMLTVALLIPASGWLADRFGTRPVFLSAIALFSLGSLACALSGSLPQLVAARVLQGTGGALLLPVGRLAILRAFPREELLRALTFVTLPGLVGPLVGPTLGGWLVEVASWHWVFLINLPVGLVGAVAASRHMPALPGSADARLDLPGFLLFGAGMVLISLALQGLGEGGRRLPALMLLLAAGSACLAGYWLHAARTPKPLFGLALFRIPTFSVGLLGNLFARLGSGAMPFLTPLFLQVGLGYSPAAAGMTLIPAALGAMFSKAFAERLIKRLGYRRVLVANTLLLAATIASFALVQRGAPQLQLLLQLGLFGIVNSLQFSAMNTLTLAGLDERSASSGNSLLSVVMQLSMSLGVAAAGVLLTAFGGHQQRAGSAAVVSTFHATYVCVGLLSAMAAFIFAQLQPAEGVRGRDKPALVDES